MNKKLLYLLMSSCLANSQLSVAANQYSVSELQDKKGQIIDDWITNNQGFSISLAVENQTENQQGFIESAKFQILIGDNDVTSLFDFQNNTLLFKGGIPLPAGENEVIVNQFIDDNWQQIGTANIQVMTSSGFKQAEWTPRLEININSQLDEQPLGDSEPSEKPHFSEVTSSIGLTTHHQNDNFSIESSINMLSVSASHVMAEPLYQTLTSFVQANVESKQLGLQYQIGNISGNVGSQSSQDNLDNLVNILTTKTENDSFSMSLPLGQIFLNDSNESESSSEPSPWLPSIEYSFQNTHQFATSSPAADVSGFNADSHLPDQVTKSHNLSASWQLETDSISIQASFSDQDNRQIGRENSDFLSLQHGISYNLQQNDRTSWSFSLGRNRQFDKEGSKIQYNNSATISFNWQSESGLGLSVNYGLSEDNDSLDTAESTSTNADIGLVKNLVNGEWWMPADGSISFRVNYNDSESLDRIFDQFNQFGTITAQLGINLSFQ